MDEEMDQITRIVVFALCFGVAGFMSLVATIALFGPWIAPLMYYLPWKGF